MNERMLVRAASDACVSIFGTSALQPTISYLLHRVCIFTRLIDSLDKSSHFSPVVI